MGLDMYIFRCQDYNLNNPEHKYENADKAAYWRKVNCVHAWFIRNYANEIDNCEPIDISLENLTDLKHLCIGLLHKCDPQEAEVYLPTQSGFFFGSTLYDEYYWDDLRDTLQQINLILEFEDLRKEAGFAPLKYFYQASW